MSHKKYVAPKIIFFSSKLSHIHLHTRYILENILVICSIIRPNISLKKDKKNWLVYNSIHLLRNIP